MGATNKTANLELPLFVGTDKPSWLGDFNGAMTSIDAGYGKQSGDISAAATAAQTAKTTADAAQEASAANTTSIQQLTAEMSDVMGDIAGLEADVTDIRSKIRSDFYTQGSFNYQIWNTVAQSWTGSYNGTYEAYVNGGAQVNKVSLVAAGMPFTNGPQAVFKISGNIFNLPQNTVTPGAGVYNGASFIGQGLKSTTQTSSPSYESFPCLIIYGSNTNATYVCVNVTSTYSTSVFSLTWSTRFNNNTITMPPSL